MSFSVYYPQSCDQAVPDHVCVGCPSDDVEHGRIRGLAFIDKDYLPTLIADPTDATKWTAGIVDKKIIIIPEVSGSYDGGSPVEGPGYGDEVSRLIGYNFTLNYKDPSYKENAAFYNAMKYSKRHVIAFRTETQTHLAEKPVRVTPKNPVTDDITAEVVWDVEAKWSQADIPAPFDTPDGVFDCFQYNP